MYDMLVSETNLFPQPIPVSLGIDNSGQNNINLAIKSSSSNSSGMNFLKSGEKIIFKSK